MCVKPVRPKEKSFSYLNLAGSSLEDVPSPNHFELCYTKNTHYDMSQPYYKPTIASKKMGGDGNFNVKIVKAKVTKLPNGKADFIQMEQMHVNVDEPSANINTITSAIQSRGGANYVVATGDGLEVDDSAGTRDMCHAVVYVVQ